MKDSQKIAKVYNKKKLDQKIAELIQKYGFGNWIEIWMEIKYKTPQYIRQRYIRSISEKAFRSNFESSETYEIIERFEEHGSKWKVISNYLPNRNELQIKNHFHSYIKPKFFIKNPDLIKKYPNTVEFILEQRFGIAEEDKEFMNTIKNSKDIQPQSFWNKENQENKTVRSQKIRNLNISNLKKKQIKKDKIFALKKNKKVEFLKLEPAKIEYNEQSWFQTDQSNVYNNLFFNHFDYNEKSFFVADDFFQDIFNFNSYQMEQIEIF